MSFITRCYAFTDLSPADLYKILRLRSEIFVVEQNCVFLDLDNKDQYAVHVMLENPVLIASARLLPPGISYTERSIGRIVTHPSVRGTGVGKILMEHSLEELFRRFGEGPVRIGAQLYARNFYERFGFVQSSDIYDEDGIDHIEMVRP